MNSKPDLKLDWCSYQAAKFAVEHWHYSEKMPAGKNIYIGVWEKGKYIGAILYGLGSGNSTNGSRYGLKTSHEMAELTRVALSAHNAPVSRIIALSLRLLKKQSPKLRLVISMADPLQNHIGCIYQAGNWIYTGLTAYDYKYQRFGKWMHHRSAGSFGSLKGLPKQIIPGKHRYLMPLDTEMQKRIEPLRKPYPKRAASIDVDAAIHQIAEGGSIPTAALQITATKQQ